MPIDHIGKATIGESAVRLPFDNPAVAAALKQGSIKDVFKILGLSESDLEQFVNQRGQEWLQLSRPEPLYEVTGAMPPPNIEHFQMHDQTAAFSANDEKTLGGIFAKAMVEGKGDDAPSDNQGGGQGEPDLQNIQNHVDEWDNFWTDILEPSIMEAQFSQELANKSAELEKQWAELLKKAKAGLIDAATLVVALTRVNVEKNGVIFTQLSKKVWNYNKQAMKVTDQLKDSLDFQKDSMTASTQLKEVNQLMTFTMNDLNATATATKTSLDSGKSLLDMIQTLTMEMGRKIGLGG
ncbi:MAG: hypothetical protein COV46_00865 [Deltaproteobacteria bacterium CG11_big_fil_rev_8_21_14_0_20_49_13]|nr:MAG: hypothetical protein COV46_00865 [Deltaproteobacteria bacterium CG11_big_fil_rev_8_21_14_0_20_49_13]